MLAFLVGGARSGKSGLAQRLAADAAGDAPVHVVVTAEALDDEMVERIGRHRADRDAGWPTVEAPRMLAAACTALPADTTVLVDCLSFWVANRVMDAVSEADVVDEAVAVTEWAVARPGWTVVVSNEVGAGVVPDNALARVFRDVLGRVNATVAGRADWAWLVVAGRVVPLAPAPSGLS